MWGFPCGHFKDCGFYCKYDKLSVKDLSVGNAVI